MLGLKAPLVVASLCMASLVSIPPADKAGLQIPQRDDTLTRQYDTKIMQEAASSRPRESQKLYPKGVGPEGDPLCES